MPVDPELLTGLGAAIAIFLTASGSAIASAHAGFFAVRCTADSGFKGFKQFVPLMQAGVLSVYGIIVGVLLCFKFNEEMTTVDGYRNVSAGLSVGLGCLASGMGMASFIKQLNETIATGTQTTPPRAGSPGGIREPLLQTVSKVGLYPSFFKMILTMIVLEAIGLYGMVVALFLLG